MELEDDKHVIHRKEMWTRWGILTERSPLMLRVVQALNRDIGLRVATAEHITTAHLIHTGD
jgi:hypothetical protein